MLKGNLKMKASGKNIEAAIENALRVCLQRVPFLEIESIERELSVGDFRVKPETPA
jgi:hypothetical protein